VPDEGKCGSGLAREGVMADDEKVGAYESNRIYVQPFKVQLTG